MPKPFRITSPAAPAPRAEESATPAPGKGIVTSRDTGSPLPTPSDLQSRYHGHSTPIDWPPAGGPDDRKKPMKLGK